MDFLSLAVKPFGHVSVFEVFNLASALPSLPSFAGQLEFSCKVVNGVCLLKRPLISINDG